MGNCVACARVNREALAPARNRGRLDASCPGVAFLPQNELRAGLSMGTYRPGDEFQVGLVNLDKLLKTTWVFDLLKRYFQYEVFVLDRIPARGPALIVMNHGLLAIDGVLLGLEIWRETGRILRGLAAHFVFRIPVLRDLFLAAGVVDGNRVTADELLACGELVAVMPGSVLASKHNGRSLLSRRKSIRAMSRSPSTVNTSIAVAVISSVRSSGIGAGIR